jgi:hypothetical protein
VRRGESFNEVTVSADFRDPVLPWDQNESESGSRVCAFLTRS